MRKFFYKTGKILFLIGLIPAAIFSFQARKALVGVIDGMLGLADWES